MDSVQETVNSTLLLSASQIPIAARYRLQRPQQGVSLIIVMAMMMTISLMTLTSFYMGRNQFRLVGNIQYLEQAFNQAESVVVQGEAWLTSGTNAASDGFTTYDASLKGIYPKGHLKANSLDRKTMDWDDDDSILFTDATTTGRYMIEQQAKDFALSGNSIQLGQATTSCKAVDIYQVTGRATIRGASRTIETTYATAASCSSSL